MTWRPVGEFRVDSGRIYVGDWWDDEAKDHAHVSITPGTYDIDARYGAGERLASLRGRLRGVVADKSKVAGKFAVFADWAGVVDAGSMDRWMAADLGAYGDWRRDFIKAPQAERVGFHPCPAGNAMLFARGGLSRGRYRLWTLLEVGRAVGFELRFVED